MRFRRPRLRGDTDLQRIDPDRLSNVLELSWAEIGDRQIKPSLDLSVGVLGQADRARRGDPLKARGDIDAVAHQISIGLLDHVAQMNADAKFDALVLSNTRVALDHGVLHFSGAAHRVNHAAELEMLPSPVRLTIRPWWTAIVGSIRSLRSALSRARIPICLPPRAGCNRPRRRQRSPQFSGFR